MENDNKLRLTIRHDDSPQDPRKDFDQLGTMVCWSRRGAVGDEQARTDYYNAPIEYRNAEIEGDALVLALYISGQQDEMTCGTELSDTFIGRQVGFIYVEASKIVAEYGSDTPETRERALACLTSEVVQYNQWMTGDVWGFVLEQGTTCKCCDHTSYEEINSCWGFYGGPEGMADYLDEDGAEEMLQGAWEERFS